MDLIAEAHFQNGDVDKAIREAHRARASSPNKNQKSSKLALYRDVHTWILAGQCDAKDGKFGEAAESFSSAIGACDDILPPNAILSQNLFLLRSEACLKAREVPMCTRTPTDALPQSAKSA